LAGWAVGQWQPKWMRRIAVNAWIWIFPFFIVMVSGLFGENSILPAVRSGFWGGLLLTFLLTVVGIVFSFPLGVLLALGRRSELPVVRWISIGYIELVRGVPLITILFMAQFMLPLFLPGGLNPDRVLRAMVGITLFSAAYLAENVRGGLQAIPNGQYEAAYALGLNGFQTMSRIILPQALRAVIPILVGQFISLFKDTSLVAIVGLFDLLGIADSVLAQPSFIGRQLEVYLFISLIYFVFSYGMSYVSQRLEKSLGVGER
jgi:general L-amino acid transport system permease protein